MSCFVGLLGLFAIGCGYLPSFLLSHLQAFPPAREVTWSERNWIVVLGAGAQRWGDTTFVSANPFGNSRVLEAIRLYRQCVAHASTCRVLVSGGDPARAGQTEADVMARDLRDAGVPAAAILLENRSNNTFENARFTSNLLAKEPRGFTLLVTSGFHVARARLFFTHFMIAPAVAPADDLHTLLSWWPRAHNFAYFEIALHEYTGMAQYWLYEALGWNAAPAKTL